MSDNKKNRPYLWAIIYGAALAVYTAVTLLDAFVIPRDIVYIEDFNNNTSFTMPEETAETPSDTAETTLGDTTENSEAPQTTPESSTDMEQASQTTSAAETEGTTASQEPSAASETTASEEASASAETTAPSSTTAPSTSAVQTTTPATTPSESVITDTSYTSEPVITDTSYTSENISISITTKRQNETTVYIADIQIKNASCLRAGLADNSFGRNVSDTTSSIAESCGAILAINGDYYGFRDKGFVMRNGYLYRTSARSGSDAEALVIYADGSFEIVDERTSDAEKLAEEGAVQIFTFGPGLVDNGEITVSRNSEVEHSMASNPRTAIGIIDDLHYVFVVSDGRTDESAGLTLFQLAAVMDGLGCEKAYNLDGGGSATMVFMGEVVNNPTTSGNSIKERKVSDIVYIGE